MFGRLFKFARSIVDSLMNNVLRQVSIVQQQVTSPIRAFVNQVVGGIWRGDGANRFVEEMTNDVIPMIAGITSLNSSFADGIRKSAELIDQAEKQATSKVGQLVDVFNAIF